jgi:hypothetical protein
MPTLIIIIAVLIISALSVLFGVNHFKKGSGAGEPSAVTYPIKDVKAGSISREDIIAELKYLAKTRSPKELSRGAMCYKMAGPPNRVEFICPVCGERTLYSVPDRGSGRSAGPLSLIVKYLARELPACTRLADSLRQYQIQLIQTKYCKKCSPQEQNPQLGLKTTYADTSVPHIVWGVTSDDCRLLKEFFDGENKHRDFFDRETPMKKLIPRLEELLGVKAGLEKPELE